MQILHLLKIMRHFGSDLLECNWSDVIIVNSTATRALIAIPVQCEIQKIGRNNTRACIINPRRESESEPCSTELIETDSLCSYILTSTEENFYCRGWRKKYGKKLDEYDQLWRNYCYRIYRRRAAADTEHTKYRPISSFLVIANFASLMHAICDDALILLLESIF